MKLALSESQVETCGITGTIPPSYHPSSVPRTNVRGVPLWLSSFLLAILEPYKQISRHESRLQETTVLICASPLTLIICPVAKIRVC
jgi:hypothetical protein